MNFQLKSIIFDSWIIRRMVCESMLSTNAEIAPMHCCHGEPDCLASIMLLFQTDWGTQHVGTAVVSVSILALLNKCWITPIEIGARE